MDLQGYLNITSEFQNIFLQYLDTENDQENYQNLIKLFSDKKIKENKNLLTLVIHILAKIIDFHYRKNNFFDKIFNIILYLKDDLKKNYSKTEIYDFFKLNKCVLRFLSDEKIITYKQSEVKVIKEGNKYFIPEYKESRLLQLIQQDDLRGFITYINTNSIQLEKGIKRSPERETNLFLIQELEHAIEGQSLYPSPIEYAAFFGSIKIFIYLLSKSLVYGRIWLYAIHGRKPEIIHKLEDDNIEPENVAVCFKFAIDCYHNELANYLLFNYIGNNNEISIDELCLKNYNFDMIRNSILNSDDFYMFCKYGHFFLANHFLNQNKKIANLRTKFNSFDISLGKPVEKEKTPLFIACKKGNYDIVQLLLECDIIDVNMKSILRNKPNKKEFTPLIVAISQDNLKIIKLLLDHKNIDINMKSTDGKDEFTPLHYAIKNNKIDAVQLLLKRNEININLTSLEFEIRDGQYTTQVYNNITPLYLAVKLGNIEIVKLLLENKNIDINAFSSSRIPRYSLSEQTALYEAISIHNIEIVKLLISHEKIDFNMISKTTYNNKIIEAQSIFDIPFFFRDRDIMKLFLNTGKFNVNTKVKKPLAFPEKDIWDEDENEMYKSRARRNLNGYSQPNKKTISEKTLLFIAIELNDADLVSYLLKNKNINVNLKSMTKSYIFYINREKEEIEEKNLMIVTPLYFAVEKGSYEIVKLLLNHKKIDVNMKSIKYSFRSQKKYYAEAQQQEEEEDIIEEDDNEETALHNAVKKGDVNIVKLLLKNKNIDVYETDSQGREPAEFCTDELSILFDQFYDDY